MSAWIVSPQLIHQLVAGAIRLGVIEPHDAQKTGHMLSRANVRSIRARYGRDDAEAKRVRPYVYHGPGVLLSDISLYKQVRCYDYQTCEYDGYLTSPAGRFALKMQRALEALGCSHDAPGYDEAPWGI